jgi:menaquinol-cytochrome c reductase cytochrome b/c subunit
MTVLVLAFGGCGGSHKTFKASERSSNALAMAVPARVYGRDRAQALAGEVVVGESGCLACHVIGRQGNNGPGPNLTHVGSRLTQAALLHVILSPRAPMPSFHFLHRAQLAELVEFLHTLQ